MPKFWLFKGELSAPGWKTLRKDYDDKKVEIVHLDPKVWAMIDDPIAETYESATAPIGQGHLPVHSTAAE